jgi:hypothetical protein
MIGRAIMETEADLRQPRAMRKKALKTQAINLCSWQVDKTELEP